MLTFPSLTVCSVFPTRVLHLNAHFSTPGISTPQPGKRYITLSPVYSHPFSRGCVHLASNDPKVPPVVNPRYLSHPLDKKILEAGLNLVLQVYNTPSLKPFIIDIVAGCVQDSERSEYVEGQLNTVWHQSGTAAMLPREDGGVVDHLLRVYGTVGLRVVCFLFAPIH
jgi:choline dehydrogenase-like flavoprotein